MELIFSKSKIDKAGELLKTNDRSRSELNDAFEVLSNWRSYHARPLDTFARTLKKRSFEINANAIIAQRLKRTPSILLKLSRHKTMRLSAMQDIGGVRAILDSVDEVYRLLARYRETKSKHEMYALNDYILKPKHDGYRGVHLIYKLQKEPKIFLEIQMRSQLQHIWATGVEVFGTLKNSSFKSGYGDREWLDLFVNLSSIFAIKEGQPTIKAHENIQRTELIKITQEKIRNLNAIENLNAYTQIYKIVAEKRKKGGQGNYSLIVLNSNKNSVSIKTFGLKNFHEATKEYIELEKRYLGDNRINVVLVNSGDLKKLELSYPNYFMDTKKLVQYLSRIIIEDFL